MWYLLGSGGVIIGVWGAALMERARAAQIQAQLATLYVFVGPRPERGERVPTTAEVC